MSMHVTLMQTLNSNVDKNMSRNMTLIQFHSSEATLKFNQVHWNWNKSVKLDEGYVSATLKSFH